MSRTHYSQDYFDKPGIKLAVHGLNLLFTFPWAEREENETDIAKILLKVLERTQDLLRRLRLWSLL